MRAFHLLLLTFCIFAAAPDAAALVGPLPPAGTTVSEGPTIVSVRGRKVTLQVPPGYDQVTVERRTARRLQPWVTVATKSCDGQGGEVVVRLRTPFPKRVLRVTGRRSPVLSDSGRLTTFYGPETNSGNLTLDGGGTFSGSAGGLSVTSTGLDSNLSLSTSVTPAANREVVESDIWKLVGDRLYFFNPYRGLQVLDVSNPAAPALLGTLGLQSTGDDLYALGTTHVALLTTRTTTFTWNQQPVRPGGALVICDVADGKPNVVANLPLRGSFVESRLVGTALYVATQKFVDTTWGSLRFSIEVTGYDLADPAHPVQRNTVTIAPPAGDSYSYVGAVQGSDKFFVVAQNYYTSTPTSSYEQRSRLQLVDIRAPNGQVQLRGSVTSKGFIHDKFKINQNDDVLSVISDVWHWTATENRRHAHLENYRITHPDVPISVGDLDLGYGESVRGTRFDGDRVYVVTFLQIDPLWIVDNSDPSKPFVSGHLDVPGFSTYLHPLGDRLVTIGFVNSKVAVSLFDVSNKAAPKLLTQLPVSEDWVYSEATFNEKAFTVLPDAGLIMLPVDQSWYRWWSFPNDPPSGGIQLVDLERDSLALRGRIDHGFAPRRSTVHREAVIALGNASLLTADINDRDAPEVLADLQLAWRTDFAWPVGNHIVQLGGSIGETDNTIAVSPATQPDEMLRTLDIGAGTLAAADLRDGYLYVVRREPAPLEEANVDGVTLSFFPIYQPAQGPLVLSIYDVSSLPQIVKKGEVRVADLPSSYSGVTLHWPQSGTLALTFEQQLFYWGYPIYLTTLDSPVAMLGSPVTTLAAADDVSPNLNPTYGPKLHCVAFDVTAADAPGYLGLTTIAPNTGCYFSRAFATGGKVFVTHQNTYRGWWDIAPMDVTATSDPANPAEPADDEEYAYGRHFLHVIDFSDPETPVLRPKISAPGALQGVARGGALVYTSGPTYDVAGRPADDSWAIHASVYDGTKLELAGTLARSQWAQALPLGEQCFVFDSRPTEPNHSGYVSYASLWALDDQFQFKLLDEAVFPGWSFVAKDSVLFAYTGLYFDKESTVYLWDTAIAALDFSNPQDLQHLGYLQLPSLGYSYLFGYGSQNPGLERITGTRADGFLIPRGDYGVLHTIIPE